MNIGSGSIEHVQSLHSLSFRQYVWSFLHAVAGFKRPISFARILPYMINHSRFERKPAREIQERKQVRGTNSFLPYMVNDLRLEKEARASVGKRMETEMRQILLLPYMVNSARGEEKREPFRAEMRFLPDATRARMRKSR